MTYPEYKIEVISHVGDLIGDAIESNDPAFNLAFRRDISSTKIAQIFILELAKEVMKVRDHDISRY